MDDIRKLVCRRCHTVMRDYEQFAPSGEFYHPKQFGDLKPNNCKNAGKTFTLRDLPSKEIELFRRKKERRQIIRTESRPRRKNP